MSQVMAIQTIRFGRVDCTSDDLIEFPEGLLGFTQLRRFILLDDPHDEVFAWLQSCEDTKIAFPVLEPELFTQSYPITLAKSDLDFLRIKGLEQARLFSIITIPEDPTQMTANLKAPIVINLELRRAKQCVLQDNQLAIREPIFLKLQQRVYQNPVQPLRGPASDLAVVVSRDESLQSAT